MTTTHTAASLAALHADDPRKLDMLAYKTVMQRHAVIGVKSIYDAGAFGDDGPQKPSERKLVPCYSASLDAAAMLEARLAERGLYHDWYVELGEMVDLMDMPKASARDRTIAAVLAAQEA